MRFIKEPKKKTMRYFKILLPIFIWMLYSCQSEPATGTTSNVEVVGVEKFSSLISPEHQLIDVRTPKEFSEGYISKAININFRADDFETQIKSLDKSKPVLVYCKSGGRSAKSAAIFDKNGFKKVYDLEGGFTAWSKANQPILK